MSTNLGYQSWKPHAASSIRGIMFLITGGQWWEREPSFSCLVWHVVSHCGWVSARLDSGGSFMFRVGSMSIWQFHGPQSISGPKSNTGFDIYKSLGPEYLKYLVLPHASTWTFWVLSPLSEMWWGKGLLSGDLPTVMEYTPQRSSLSQAPWYFISRLRSSFFSPVPFNLLHLKLNQFYLCCTIFTYFIVDLPCYVVWICFIQSNQAVVTRG